jgi:hypothetical protein
MPTDDVTGARARLFRMRETVRLLNPHGDIPVGTLGSVLGWFTTGGTYVVNFADAGLPGEEACVAEVQADEIALAELA